MPLSMIRSSNFANPNGTLRAPRVGLVKLKGFRTRKLNKRQKGQVKRIVNFGRELKFTVKNLSYTDISTTPVIYDLMENLTQGQTDTTRIGDRVTLGSNMEVRLSVIGPESLTGLVNDIYNHVRIIIFQYKIPAVSGTNPVASDILLTGPSAAIDIWSHYNHDKRSEFTILYDSTYGLINNQNSAVGGTGFTAA